MQFKGKTFVENNKRDSWFFSLSLDFVAVVTIFWFKRNKNNTVFAHDWNDQ